MNKVFVGKNALYVIIVGGISFNTYFNTEKIPSMMKMEYRTDTQPLVSRFGETSNIDIVNITLHISRKQNSTNANLWIKLCF